MALRLPDAAAAHRGRCRHRQDHRGRPDPARADGSRRSGFVLGALPAASRRAMGRRAEGPLRDRSRRGHGWTARRLERGLPLAQTLFDAYPFTVVSLDYIKAEKRRDGFARACPDFVIVDEAHACVGTHKGRQQRFELLSGLARNPERRMVLLTATPHSGDEEAFGRLLSLIEPSFASMNFDDARYRERLARHFVQRRRIDLVSGDWDEERAFPKHETTEFPYRLSKAHLDFQEAALDYCLGIVSRVGVRAAGATPRLLGHAGPDALYRLFAGGGPERAAEPRSPTRASVLNPRSTTRTATTRTRSISSRARSSTPTRRCLRLVTRAEELIGKPDPKLAALVDALTPLDQEGRQSGRLLPLSGDGRACPRWPAQGLPEARSSRP